MWISCETVGYAVGNRFKNPLNKSSDFCWKTHITSDRYAYHIYHHHHHHHLVFFADEMSCEAVAHSFSPSQEQRVETDGNGVTRVEVRFAYSDQLLLK